MMYPNYGRTMQGRTMSTQPIKVDTRKVRKMVVSQTTPSYTPKTPSYTPEQKYTPEPSAPAPLQPMVTLVDPAELAQALAQLRNYRVVPSNAPNMNLATLIGIWATAFTMELRQQGKQYSYAVEVRLYNEAQAANTNAKIVKVLTQLRDKAQTGGAIATASAIRNFVAKRYYDEFESKGIWDVLIENGTPSTTTTFQPSTFQPPDGSGYQPPHQQPSMMPPASHAQGFDWKKWGLPLAAVGLLVVWRVMK